MVGGSRTRLGTKKDRPRWDDQYVQESAWVQLRQAAHHWTTVVTLLDGDPVGVIPLGRTLQDAFNDARVLKNDNNRVGHLLEKGKPFLCHSRLRRLQMNLPTVGTC